MSKRVKFQLRWFSVQDSNKNDIGQWAKKLNENDEYSCLCVICNINVSTSKGLQCLHQHADTIKHKRNLYKIAPKQLTLSMSATTCSSTETGGTRQVVAVYNSREAACKAELLWSMETVACDYSLNSCQGKKELFNIMFPGGIQDTFTISPTKVRYLITEALGPYFKGLLLEDLHHSDTYFTLQYDETSNVKSKKELQIRVRYFANKENCIVNKHLVTYFIGKADADTLFKYLIKALDEHQLSLKNVLMVACDGPNVNKKVIRCFKEKRKELKQKQIIDIGSCPLHTVHNAFLKGLENLEIDVSDFIVKVYYYFHKRDLRVEDFEKVQVELKLPTHRFIKHTSTRWLTIGPAADRLIEQFAALEHYFFKLVPKKYQDTLGRQCYKDIVMYLKNNLLKPILCFVVYISDIFTREFTLLFQKEEPLIHILYKQLEKLIKILLSSVLKPENLEHLEVSEYSEIDRLLIEPSKCLPYTEIECGEKAKRIIDTLSERDKTFILNSFRKFYVAAIKHICQKALGSGSASLKYFQCLAPGNVRDKSSRRKVIKMVECLPVDLDIDQVSIEWKLLQLDSDVDFNCDCRIDIFWNKVFELSSPHNNESPRYPSISTLVKASLALSHGSADVERGFSRSGRVLTEDRAQMSERMLNSQLAVIDGLKIFENKTHCVPITKELLKLAQGAHRSYQTYLDELKRREKEEENLAQAKKLEVAEAERKKKETIDKLNQLEKRLKEAELFYNESRKLVDSMQQEVTRVLGEASKNKDMNKVNVASEMCSGLNKLKEKENVQRLQVEKLRSEVMKRKNTFIGDFPISKSRKKVR